MFFRPISHAASIKETSGQQHVNQWIRAHFWFVVYADLLTCREEAPVEDEVVEYEMVFLNPDSSGQATDHFGDDLRGQQVTGFGHIDSRVELFYHLFNMV